MHFLYDFVIFFYRIFIGLASLLGNTKAGLWIKGRHNWTENISGKIPDDSTRKVWIHCSSLGEFEQGRPLIEKIKNSDPSVFIVLTFFSPSGYEIRKDYKLANLVCYLPIDTKINARTFVDLISPSYVIFVKYEFWNHYFNELSKRKIPLYMVSAIFRPSQLFFKWYGNFFRVILKNVTHFFVQDQMSVDLLKSIGFNNAELTGDTRFDRVKNIVSQNNKIDLLEQFKNGNSILIAGSTWPDDEKIILSLLKVKDLAALKIILAPHEVKEARIREIVKEASSQISKTEITLFSNPENLKESRLLVIDNIGLLSTAYSYGTIAWIGGGFGKGIHNILEAATYGLPITFGPNFHKFKEAVDLIERKGAFVVSNISEAEKIIVELLRNEQFRQKCAAINTGYVDTHTGATEKIFMKLPQQNANFKNRSEITQ